MNSNTLVIMAAGFGSRYKGGIKQMDGVGPSGEWIMDYSIYDAYQAGIRKVVIIIRDELTEFMQAHFDGKLPQDLELQLVYQSVKDLPMGFEFPERVKPWGTGQAILCCKDVVKDPFIVINADDYYGTSIYNSVNEFLNQGTKDFCMAGFFLKNTFSENGGVNRGICKVDSNMNLQDIKETYKIVKTETGAKGSLIDGTEVQLDPECYCSLNLWGFTPAIFDELDIRFKDFLSNLTDLEKQEFLLPDIVQNMIKEEHVTLKVLPTHDEWFGMTYQEDKEYVKNKIEKYCEEGKYPNPLWN